MKHSRCASRWIAHHENSLCQASRKQIELVSHWSVLSPLRILLCVCSSTEVHCKGSRGCWPDVRRTDPVGMGYTACRFEPSRTTGHLEVMHIWSAQWFPAPSILARHIHQACSLLSRRGAIEEQWQLVNRMFAPRPDSYVLPRYVVAILIPTQAAATTFRMTSLVRQ